MRTLIVAFWISSSTVLAAGVEPLPPSTVVGDRIQYAAEWFTQFAPRTALDMVTRTPGFVLLEKEDRRGYSGAVGNVLVDGARPSAKEQSLKEILQRIPAAQVQRIEILRGAETAADASGEAVLVNVVRSRFSGQGAWSLGLERARGNRPAPDGWASWSGRVGDVDYGLGASTYSLRRDLPGKRALTNGTGTETGERIDASPREFEEYALNGELSTDVWGGRLRLTGQGYQSRYHEDSTVDTVASKADLNGVDLNPYTERKHTAEGGAHFERPLGPWQMTAVALLTRNRFDSDAGSTHFGSSPTVDSIFAQTLARDSGESILRTTFARQLDTSSRIEMGIEGALNTLDASLQLALEKGGVPKPISVPNSNVSVTERRGEAFIAHVVRLSPQWSLESRLATEASRLAFSGDTTQSVALHFIKPSVQLTRSFATNSEVRVRVKRDVGQLDFTDFVSAASLADNRINGGNPDLRPQSTWSAELAADFRLHDDIALGITVFRRWLHDTADLLPVGEGKDRVDAPGNIGPARVYGTIIAYRSPLTRLIPGGTLEVDATLASSAVADPVTGQTRSISKFEKVRLNAAFRQDVPAHGIAWGVSYKRNPTLTQYRLTEIDASRESPSLDVFTELALSPSLKLKMMVLSTFDEAELRSRRFFEPDRRAALTGTEASTRHPGRWFQLSLSGNF